MATNWSLGAVPLSNDGNVATFTNTSPDCVMNSSSARVCNHVDFTNYTNTITMTNTLTSYSNTTLWSWMHVAGTSNLIVGGAWNLISNWFSRPNGLSFANSGVTATLVDNWTVQDAVFIANAWVVNGSTLYVNWNLTVTNSLSASSTKIVMQGNWTRSGAGVLTCPLTFNSPWNTIILSGIIFYSTGTMVYTAGTITTTGSTLKIASATLDLAGTTLSNFYFFGATTALVLKSEVKIAGLFSNVDSVSFMTISSNTLWTQRKLTLLQWATQDLVRVNATDIDSGDWLTIFPSRGEFYNCKNWNNQSRNFWIKFDWTQNYAVSANNSSITGNVDFSIEAWVYIPTWMTTSWAWYPWLVSWGLDLSGDRVFFGLNGNTTTQWFCWRYNGGQYVTMPNNARVHILRSRTGWGDDMTGNNIYINGAAVTKTNALVTLTPAMSAHPYYLWLYLTRGAAYAVDNIKIYTSALTAADAVNCYTGNYAYVASPAVRRDFNEWSWTTIKDMAWTNNLTLNWAPVPKRIQPIGKNTYTATLASMF